MARISIKDSKSHNPNWHDNFLPGAKMPERMTNESNDMYELRCRTRADINMANAKNNFDRPAYYTRFMKGEK